MAVNKPRRIIQAAMIEGVGPVAARELLAMPADDWGIIRDRITDHACGSPEGLLARCMWCGGRVFIQTRVLGEKRLPYFKHFAGGDPDCAWYQGKTLSPDDARAAQYDGTQESMAHRFLCEQIDQLVRLDSRYITSLVGKYHTPTSSAHGRYPDIYLEWEGFQPFAIELQLSNTFQTEISGRSTYYERENITLIWVLYGFDPENHDIAQSFRDVIRRHRGNAFVLDRDAVEASKKRKTLVLKCYLKNADDRYDPSFLVRLDELKVPNRGLAFFEDRVTTGLCERINARRRPWFKALRPFINSWSWKAIQSCEVAGAINELKEKFPKLSSYSDGEEECYEIGRLIAVVFSVISAANGKQLNYVSRHQNIKGMLNTLLNADSGILIYALIIQRLLRFSAVHPLLDGTVGDHLERAQHRMEGNLCLEYEPEWQIMRYLVPEVFDPITRDEMIYLEILPAWAASPYTEAQFDEVGSYLALECTKVVDSPGGVPILPGQAARSVTAAAESSLSPRGWRAP